MTKKNSSTTLNYITVQDHALLEKGISCPKAFEDAFLAQPEKWLIESAASNAWNGNVMCYRAANQIARFLGCRSYTELLKVPETLWSELIKKSEDASSFVSVYESSLKRGMLDFQLTNNMSLHKISLDYSWRIDIRGDVDEMVLIVLRSDAAFSILAPIRTDGKDGYPNRFTEKQFVYPPLLANPLVFSSVSDIGRYEIIVIKSSKIDIQPRNVETDGYAISLEALNRFARRLLNSKQDFKVGSYKFLVVQ